MRLWLKLLNKGRRAIKHMAIYQYNCTISRKSHEQMAKAGWACIAFPIVKGGREGEGGLW
jgi:hypothetical protein